MYYRSELLYNAKPPLARGFCWSYDIRPSSDLNFQTKHLSNSETLTVYSVRSYLVNVCESVGRFFTSQSPNQSGVVAAWPTEDSSDQTNVAVGLNAAVTA